MMVAHSLQVQNYNIQNFPQQSTSSKVNYKAYNNLCLCK